MHVIRSQRDNLSVHLPLEMGDAFGFVFHFHDNFYFGPWKLEFG